jgi:hypothetical protein
MRRWTSALSLCGLLPLAGCLGDTPERARIDSARLVQDGGVPQLELTQELRFSRTMREALANGIPLRLNYWVRGCGLDGLHVLHLQYVPLTRHYERRFENEPQARAFERRSALLASLDRLRLPLAAAPPPGCAGTVVVALDLTTLPTPLRFPALLRPEQWRLVSPPAPWPTPSSRA